VSFLSCTPCHVHSIVLRCRSNVSRKSRCKDKTHILPGRRSLAISSGLVAEDNFERNLYEAEHQRNSIRDVHIRVLHIKDSDYDPCIAIQRGCQRKRERNARGRPCSQYGLEGGQRRRKHGEAKQDGSPTDPERARLLRRHK
jgi:hypothetical protein